MRVLIDTCVVLDLIQYREPFVADAYNIFLAVEEDKIEPYITVKQLMDIHYVTKHILHNEGKTREIIKNLYSLVNILDCSQLDARNAINSLIKDYEDALLNEVAKNNKIDYIVTRNIKDFKNSNIKVIEPKDLIKMLQSK